MSISIDEVRSLVGQRFSDVDIGKRYGVSKYVIRGLRRKAGLVSGYAPQLKRKLTAKLWTGAPDHELIDKLYNGRRYGP